MFNFNDITNLMFNRGITFSLEDYMFCVHLVLGENPTVSYAMAYAPHEYKPFIGTEDEDTYLNGKFQECDLMLQQPHIIKLKQELEDLLTTEIQNKALNLENYRFTGGQIAQILQNLLHNRVADLDSASTKDVISLIKMLTDQFGLDGGSDFEKHFIQIYPKFNALCTRCNREFQIVEGIGAVCPHCGAVYMWNASENKFVPKPAKL